MKPLQHLKDLMMAEQRRKYPNVPERVLPIPNLYQNVKNKERRELKRIVAYIQLTGGIAHISDSSAVRIDDRVNYIDSVGKYRTIGSVHYRKNPNIEVGAADITATIGGKTVYIELKRKYKKGKDRQSEAQKAFQQKVEKAGAKYIIVESFEDFYNLAVSTTNDAGR